jgi:HTH-type transcriptional regulator/antitoxin HigA
MAAKQTGLSPDLLIHPGETLREALEDRGMRQKELALRTGFTEKHISKVLSGQSSISSALAIALETALGIDAVFWLNLQANHDIELALLGEPDTVGEDEINIMREMGPIVKYWQKEGSLVKNNDKRGIVLQLRSLLGVSSLTVIPSLQVSAAFRASNTGRVNLYVMFAWIKMCEMAVSGQITKGRLDLECLKNSIPAIKRLMFADPGDLQKELARIFGDCGIKFCIVPHFKGAPVQGFIEKNPDEEMILCMTIRQKYADIFWFSLFHEVGHILGGDISNRFIDYAGVPDELERRADEYAGSALIPPERYHLFLESGDLSLQNIRRFAKSINVLSCIIIGRLQKEKIIPYSQFSNEKLRYEWT